MAAVGHLDLRGSAWLIWGQALFVASGLIWLVILIPTQFLQARQARAFAEGGAIPQSYWRHSRRWVIWGTMQPSFLPPPSLSHLVSVCCGFSAASRRPTETIWSAPA